MQLGAGLHWGRRRGLTRAVTPSGRILFDNFMCALFVRVCVCVQQLPVKRVANAAADDDDGDLH